MPDQQQFVAASPPDAAAGLPVPPPFAAEHCAAPPPQAEPAPPRLPLPSSAPNGASSPASDVTAPPGTAVSPPPVDGGSSETSPDPRAIVTDRPVDPAAIGEEESAVLCYLRATPPWLFSMIFHAVALIVLALWVFHVHDQQPIELTAGYVEPGEQLLDDQLDQSLDSVLDVENPALAPSELSPVPDPLALPPIDIPAPGDLLARVNVESLHIGHALDGRQEGRREALLRKYGGNEVTENAVRLGLGWLKRYQRRDGSWSLRGTYSDGGREENLEAATAMALLAFQGAGHTHQQGQHKDEVARAWKFLLRIQQPDGSFFRRGSHNQRFYTNAMCTIALCELYGMSEDSALRGPAQRAVDYLVGAQGDGGGWRYTPNQGGDLSVTGWVVMALQSARMAKLDVPEKTLHYVSKFLDTLESDGGATYRYMPRHDVALAMTAEGLLCRQYLGWKQDDERLLLGAGALLESPIDWNRRNVYYWYYATQVLHHLGGDRWRQWNDVMRKLLPARQVHTGSEAGSWSREDNSWGDEGGRLYVTCLSLYMLEVYYRHLPLYRTEGL